MQSHEVEQAVTAVAAMVARLGLAADDVVVVQNSTRLSLRVLPADLFARVAPMKFEASAAAEVVLSRQLAAVGAPVAALDPRVEPVVHDCGGFAVSMWTHYDAGSRDPLSDAGHAHALERLHAGLRRVDIAAPRATARVDEALDLVSDPALTPGLDAADRTLLLDALNDGRQTIDQAEEQLLHGEPHAGNVLNTLDGPRFIDLETHCRGPVELDLAHMPSGVAEHYPGIDAGLLEQCQRLVLAMVGAWRWDAQDGFPDGRRHGRTIVGALQHGPPWPTIDEL